jgi:ApaG protein
VSLPLPELSGFRVSVDKLEFNEAVQVTPDRPFGFVYYITIHNDSPDSLTIKGRKWVVSNANGSVNITEGDGVVGEFPRLMPGEKFEYNSYHLVDSDSVARGAYLAVADGGRAIVAPIPPFEMRVPAQGRPALI